MKIPWVIVAFVFLGLSCNAPQVSKEIRGDLTVLHLDGKPYDRGFQYGQLMKAEIRQVISAWKSELPVPPDQYPREILLHYREIAENYAPDILMEVQGIAEGSGIAFDELFAFQASEEMENVTPAGGKYCTSVSTNLPLNDPVIVAQNMDAPAFLHGHPLLLHIIEPGLETFIFTSPGLIALNGMNSAGVAISCNSMSMLRNNAGGLPVAFIVRECLRKKSFDEAVSFIKNVPHSTPQAYTVGGTDTTVCLECSPTGCFHFFAFEDKGITLHTNFPAANRDFSAHYIALLAAFGKTPDDPYYCPRYFLAFDLIVASEYQLNHTAVMTILAARAPEAGSISNDNTYGSTIMVLGDRPSLYIAAGRPDTTQYIHVGFDRLAD